uniref:Uncharacterized protein n=1 Tax=Acrobeloides nanus TaxID=290746 RepID=A0A914E7D1_9BILA
MFVLAILKDTVKIPPVNLGDDFKSTLIQKIDAQYANYVVYDVGLCITFHDFVKIGASFIIPGDPATYTPVEFRYVVFRPRRDEVLEGIISHSNSEGITISMDFFEDIHVSPDKLPKVSKL